MTDSVRRLAILDANVLFSYRKRNILLRFFEAGIFRARWTEQIIHEWTRNLLLLKPHLEDSLTSQARAMRKHFPGAVIVGYETLVSSLVLPDPDDRHVLAAAIHCGADNIVTENIKDFPSNVLSKYAFEALSADEFLERLFFYHRVDAITVLREMRRNYSKPAFSPSEFIQDLSFNGLPKLVMRASEHSAEI